MCNVKFDEWWRLHFFWIAVCAASVIAGFAAGWAWRDRPEALGNVSILSTLTAIGTVGATVFSAYSVYQGRVLRQERDSRARFIVLEPKREQFSKLLKGAASVYDAMAGLLGSMMYELEDRAGASSHHRSVLLTPGAFDAPGVSDDEFKIVDFETLGLMRLVADITAKIKANIPALFSKDVHAHFMEASATMRALDDLISLLITKIETLYPDIGIAEKCLDKRGKFRSRLKDELDRQAQIVSSSST